MSGIIFWSILNSSIFNLAFLIIQTMLVHFAWQLFIVVLLILKGMSITLRKKFSNRTSLPIPALINILESSIITKLRKYKRNTCWSVQWFDIKKKPFFIKSKNFEISKNEKILFSWKFLATLILQTFHPQIFPRHVHHIHIQIKRSVFKLIFV